MTHATPADIIYHISQAIREHDEKLTDPRAMFPPEAMTVIRRAVKKANEEEKRHEHV